MIADGSASSFDSGRQWAARQRELDNRIPSCPRCHAANPNPCIGRDSNNLRIELETVHLERAKRRSERW